MCISRDEPGAATDQEVSLQCSAPREVGRGRTGFIPRDVPGAPRSRDRYVAPAPARAGTTPLPARRASPGRRSQGPPLPPAPHSTTASAAPRRRCRRRRPLGAGCPGGRGGRSPARLAAVALTTRSNPPAGSVSSAAALTRPCPANRPASATARDRVRLATTSRWGRSSSRGPITPRAAPPAPSRSTDRPSMPTARFRLRSRTRPTPSVLSPHTAAPSNHSVFTAPARAARSERRPESANASSLNGIVTLSPRPPSAWKRSTASRNPPGSTRSASYATGSPVSTANRRWMKGDLL